MAAEMPRATHDVRWTNSSEVLARVRRAWERGHLLVKTTDTPNFPWPIPLKGPRPRDVSACYANVQAWIGELNAQARPTRDDGYDLDWRSLGERTAGTNQIPTAALFQSAEHAIAFLGLRSELAQWQNLLAYTSSAFPLLLPWVISHPLLVIRHALEWELLTRVVEWINAHPRPGIYLRQLNLPGIDTKFIGRHEALLKQMLDALLDESADRKDEQDFSRRFGFATKPLHVRVRILDPQRSIGGLRLLSAPIEQLARIDPGVRRVVVTENETNGLAFPELSDALVLFGLGYAAERLAEIPWLHRCAVWYWGDIDTDGFVMLDRIRNRLPHIRSFLMDEATVCQNRSMWGHDPKPTHQSLTRLTAHEFQVWQGLITNRWAPGLRIEQEHIPFAAVHAAMLIHLESTPEATCDPVPLRSSPS